MDKIARIRQEIKRRRLHFNKEAEKYQALNNGYSQNCYGARDALRDLENFLDTLSEEPDKSLEGEVKRYLREKCSGDDEPAISEIARHFAEWQKEQMLKDAEECELYWDEDYLRIDLNMAALGYSERDKVEVIVLKAEEE